MSGQRKYIAGAFPPGTRCSYCLTTEGQMERDHIIPIAKGGTDSYDNIVPACQSCNAAKGTRSLIEFVTGTRVGTDEPYTKHELRESLATVQAAIDAVQKHVDELWERVLHEEAPEYRPRLLRVAS